MSEANQFRCGCIETDLTGFGRGASRAKRIANHLNRPCLKCSIAAAVANLNIHPVAKGLQDGQPVFYTPEEWAARVERKRPCYRV